MLGASLALFAGLGACHVQKSSVTICVLPAPSGWRATSAKWGNAKAVDKFLSTPSGWRATSVTINQQDQDAIFLSTPSGWRATQGARLPNCTIHISIHVLRVEGDLFVHPHKPLGIISIHALRVEGDRRSAHGLRRGGIISIHALRVEGDAPKSRYSSSLRRISIHALQVEGDEGRGKRNSPHVISIHALRVEGDFQCQNSEKSPENFYPRPPGGGRPI